jgi:ribosomal protein S18 acetylase RimI-like enzyme
MVEFQLALARETEPFELDPATVFKGVTRPFDSPDLATYYVATIPLEGSSGDRVIGMLMTTWEWSDWRNGRILWIQSVYTDKSFRRQGVFRGLFEYVRDTIAMNTPDISAIRLYVEHDNERAQATYKSLGMEVEGYKMMKWSKGSF